MKRSKAPSSSASEETRAQERSEGECCCQHCAGGLGWDEEQMRRNVIFKRCGGWEMCGFDGGTSCCRVRGVHGFDWVGVGLAAALGWNGG